MFVQLVFAAVSLHLSFGDYDFCEKDPCIDGNTFVLQSKERRTPNCPYLNDNLCDAYISDGWYKSQEPMLKTCTRLNTCGTVFPVWMNGTDPTSQEGVVTRNACLSGPTNCCQKTYQIKVKSCDTFKAYCLPHLGSCPERYCFGKTGDCTKTTTSTKSTTTNIVPTTKKVITQTTTTTTIPTTIKLTTAEKIMPPGKPDSKNPRENPCGQNDKTIKSPPAETESVLCLKLWTTVVLALAVLILIIVSMLCGRMTAAFHKDAFQISQDQESIKDQNYKMSNDAVTVIPDEKKIILY